MHWIIANRGGFFGSKDLHCCSGSIVFSYIDNSHKAENDRPVWLAFRKFKTALLSWGFLDQVHLIYKPFYFRLWMIRGKADK